MNTIEALGRGYRWDWFAIAKDGDRTGCTVGVEGGGELLRMMEYRLHDEIIKPGV